MGKQETKSIPTKFTDLPLSASTLSGLESSHFINLTPIQQKTIPLALKGCDILGAAKTGSGKTLAFLIPVLENLYRAQCVGQDAGLCAMIISPTRELAIQIFDILVKIGRKGHTFAAGLVIGGKNFGDEKDALARMNIVVCTPGRILQHLSQTVMFNCDNLRMLVLDEADRIMDMGFQDQLDAIIEYLPKDRQTLLFSATQTKKVSDLARLSLKEPEYISTETASSSATPDTLQQNYIVTELSNKLDTLWSFLQSTKKAKILVFLSSGKQVRFVYESFRRMQPGIPLLHLHGRHNQKSRLDITSQFSSAKHSCLFATDVVARGLDFPAVDWVVQIDCPEDVDTYIHRVGRTARYQREGRAILFVDPSEEAGFLTRLEQRKIPIERINVRQKKQKSIKDALQSMCFKDPTLKYLGQKAFISYVRSIHLQKDKDIFQLDKLDLEQYAASLGLPGAPKIKFVKGEDAKAAKNAPRYIPASLSDASDVENEHEDENENDDGKVRTKYDRMFERRNQDVLAPHYSKIISHDDLIDNSLINNKTMNDSEDEDDLFSVKRRIPVSTEDQKPVGGDGSMKESNIHRVTIEGASQPIIIDSNRKLKQLSSKKALLKYKSPGSRLIFDDQGNAHAPYAVKDEEAFKSEGQVDEQRRKYVESEKERVLKEDEIDREVQRMKKKEKTRKRKEREKNEDKKGGEHDEDDDEGDVQVTLGRDSTDGEEEEGEKETEEEMIEERTKKRRKLEKKWFQRDDDDNDSNGRTSNGSRNVQIIEDVERLEDLEALASQFV